jgi:hypothetical protein
LPTATQVRVLKINLIEIGHDYQTYAVKSTIKNLVENNSLRKYISICTSKDMHDIREKTIKNIFNLNVDFERYDLDYENQSLKSILYKEKDDENVLNFCLILRATISNYLKPESFLGYLTSSLSSRDYCILSTTLTDNTGKDRVEREQNMSASRAKRYDWLMKLLGIYKHVDMVHYEYDAKTKVRRRGCVMRDNIELSIKIGGKTKTINLPRDKKLTYLYSQRYTLDELVNILERPFEVHQINTINNEQVGFVFMSNRK